MLTLYTANTGNGRKIPILLEELGLDYEVVRIDLTAKENRQPAYLDVNPMGKIPAMVETFPDGSKRRMFGSGTILLALAEREGKLLPVDPADRLEALSWLMAGIGDLFPAWAGEVWLAKRDPEPAPHALNRFRDGLVRCLDAAEGQLAKRLYLAGEYSIADIAWFTYAVQCEGATDGRPNLRRWLDDVAARPAVQRGLASLA